VKHERPRGFPPVLGVIFLVVAFSYASVGLGGGSSYTALLALFGEGVQAIPMISLTLNLVVTSVGSLIFFRHHHARLRLIAPFLISSIPMAYLRGALHLPREWFYWILLVSLVLAVARIYLPRQTGTVALGPKAKVGAAPLAGAPLGSIAGIVGIGGGIYLVPLIIILGLGTTKEAATCGAVFVWVNSISGLLARLQYHPVEIKPYLILIGAVLAGGSRGAFMGASRFPQQSNEEDSRHHPGRGGPYSAPARKISGFYV